MTVYEATEWGRVKKALQRSEAALSHINEQALMAMKSLDPNDRDTLISLISDIQINAQMALGDVA